ncbi:MAG: hypothetical protein ACR2MY_07680 [Candidatus Dormibacteria bacterium]
MPRVPRTASLLLALAASLGSVASPVGAHVAAADNSNPCDVSPSLPYCDSAIGPLRDVTASWRAYQPSLLQPVPISDYCAAEPTCAGGDPEDRSPVGTPSILAAGWCATETAHQPASGPLIPPSTETSTVPTGITAPPGKNHPFTGSHYCLLRYLAADFAPLCAGCHRILIDYAAIPGGTYNPTSPAADGHWAARFTTDSSLTATTPVNEHSPNIKNLCADKFVNSAPGADCLSAVSSIDLGAHEFEGDATIFHHFPFEGRYFNGPSYLAGNGSGVPLHWVNGAFFDVDPAGAASLAVWYNAGYRGRGDAVPDTDQSYGCPCEAPGGIVPGVAGSGHTSWSPSLVLSAGHTPSQPPLPAGSAPATPQPAATGGGLPNSSVAGESLMLPFLVLSLMLALGWLVTRARRST